MGANSGKQRQDLRSMPRPIYSGKILAEQSRFPPLRRTMSRRRWISMTASSPIRPLRSSLPSRVIPWSGPASFDGATLIVDRSLRPKSSNIVIADVDGEWMVKRLYKRSGVIKLLSENPLNEPIVLKEGQELVIFGVVTYVINEPK